MTKNLRRRAAALATVCACLALTASPAAATTHAVVVTGGTLIAIGTNSFTETFPLGGSGGTGCGGTLVVDDGTGTTVDVTGYSDVQRITFWASTNHYIVITTRLGSTPGTITGTSISSASVTLRTDFFLAANNTSTATDCATTGTRSCRLTTTLHFSGTLSSTPIGASTTVHLAAPPAGIVATPPCAVPWATFNGGTAAISSLTAHATT